MLAKTVFLEMYSLFYDHLIKLPASRANYLSFDQYNIPSDIAKGIKWFIFHNMAQDFIRELLNEINSFMTNIRHLDAWSKVNNQCPKDHKADLAIEMLSPAASCTINRVYVVKQRLIYVSSMLLHQTIMIIDPSRKDSHLVEKDININTLSQLNSASINITELKRSLRKIDDNSFRNKSRNFRSSYQHKIPPNIEIGLSAFVTRNDKEKGEISYGLGGQEPLTIKDILPILYEQHEICVSAFHQVWKSLNEQLDIWKRKMPITT